ncbi:hypothetical protein BpHYR1_024302 [Brachionus plicatilis]|uniref:Uncharacterized protein n=1 Tax=Brachionus plicatilis TaxID=10195 RepID=A0A3M7SDE4_BRAPC|nr:hypothetical protein BpHYR1_024302 [Brachionus plicatilis]
MILHLKIIPVNEPTCNHVIISSLVPFWILHISLDFECVCVYVINPQKFRVKKEQNFSIWKTKFVCTNNKNIGKKT